MVMDFWGSGSRLLPIRLMWRGVSRHYLNYITSSPGWFFTSLSYSESDRLTSHSVSRFCGLSRVSSTATWIHCPFPRRYSRPRTRLYYRQNENNFLPERGVARVCVYTSIRFPTISGFLDLSTDLWSRARRRVNEKKAVHGVTLADNLWHFCHLGYRSCDKKTSLYRQINMSRQCLRARSRPKNKYRIN